MPIFIQIFLILPLTKAAAQNTANTAILIITTLAPVGAEYS